MVEVGVWLSLPLETKKEDQLQGLLQLKGPSGSYLETIVRMALTGSRFEVILYPTSDSQVTRACIIENPSATVRSFSLITDIFF